MTQTTGKRGRDPVSRVRNSQQNGLGYAGASALGLLLAGYLQQEYGLSENQALLAIGAAGYLLGNLAGAFGSAARDTLHDYEQRGARPGFLATGLLRALSILGGLVLLVSPARADLDVDYREPCARASGAPLEALERMLFRVFEGGTNLQIGTDHSVPATSSAGCQGTREEPLETAIPFDESAHRGETVDVIMYAVSGANEASGPSNLLSIPIPDPPAAGEVLEICVGQGAERRCAGLLLVPDPE